MAGGSRALPPTECPCKSGACSGSNAVAGMPRVQDTCAQDARAQPSHLVSINIFGCGAGGGCGRVAWGQESEALVTGIAQPRGRERPLAATCLEHSGAPPLHCVSCHAAMSPRAKSAGRGHDAGGGQGESAGVPRLSGSSSTSAASSGGQRHEEEEEESRCTGFSCLVQRRLQYLAHEGGGAMMMMMVVICLLRMRSAGNEVLMRGPLAGDGRRWRW